jgi:hypothetical protein
LIALLLAVVLAVDQSQERPGLRVTPAVAAAGRGAVTIEPVAVLADASLENAVRSGLPLRLRFRVELWRDRFLADLVGQRRWAAILVYDPLDREFLVRADDAADAGARRFASYAAARAALETPVRLPLAPPTAGRYYYTAVLDVETLQLSDLEELQRWLRGEIQPAVSGNRSVGGAVSEGARRLMIRVLRLPDRRFEARSDRFTVN